MEKHSTLSPSAAHRWLNCTAAPLLEACVPDTPSDFANEGRLAHAICAKLLKKAMQLPIDKEEAEIAEYSEQYYTGEMREYTEAYYVLVMECLTAARVKTPDAQLLVETRVDLSHWVPGAYGTADAIILADDTLEIIDFKYGKGVAVSANRNPQMMIYALGTLDAFADLYRIEHVRMTIVQPRTGNLSQYELTPEELTEWAETVLLPKAEEALSGGKQAPGEWCRFCKVRNSCRALAALALEHGAHQEDPRLLTPEEIADEVLPKLPIIKAWVSSVEEYALQQALGGVALPGYKVVAGRSVRKITDPEGAMQALAEGGYPRETYMKPPELRGITDLERLVGKKMLGNLLGDFITKPAGKPTLVPDDDPRPAYNSAASDFANVNLD